MTQRNSPNRSWAQTILRTILGLFLLTAGAGHLTWHRTEFLAQVPPWVPLDPDFVVLASGVVEVVLGLSLIFLKNKQEYVGILVAAFFVAIFPGNISQYVNGVSAFGLDTDTARLIRLFFQPVLVYWAIWSCGSWGRIQSILKSNKN